MSRYKFLSVTAADSGRSRVSCAAQVCLTCKGRKKKCDKVLPCCGYCVRKRLCCGYEPRPRKPALQASQNARPAPFALVTSHTIPSALTASESSLYLHAHHLIRATGQSVDDISAHYFQGLHRYLPIISQTHFHGSLITPGATPAAGFSVLLLSICLVTTFPELGRRTGDATDPCPVDRRSLYLATKSFFAQVQALFPPSVPLIQAGLLLALYEYVYGRPEEAFVSIAGCARMAYAARIHLCNRPSPQPSASQKAVPTTDTQTNADLQLQAEESANTWWGIIICERIFFCEVTVTEQPLIAVIPSRDVRLPTEPIHLEQSGYLGAESVPYIPVSYLNSIDVGAFGRAAQAAWLLDQVLKSFELPSLDSRLIQLRSLDTTLQTFLGVVMQQCDGKGGIFCEAIAITVRALFTLHWHVLSQPLQMASSKHQSLGEWCKCSKSTLDTATKMILDIVEAHMDPHLFACVPPSYSYIVRAALKHIYGRAEWKDDRWLRSAEERLRTSLDEFYLCH